MSGELLKTTKARYQFALQLFGFLCVVGLAFYLRWLHYTDKTMWFDEVIVVIYAKHSFIDIVRYLYPDIHQPLYYWLVKILQYFSWDDAVRKAPSLVFGVMGVVSLQWIAYRLTNFRVALVGSFLLAVNEQNIMYSQMLRMYTMGACLTFIATYALHRFIENHEDRRAKITFIVVSVLAFHTHVTNFILFLFQLLFYGFLLVEWANFKFFQDLKSLLQKTNQRSFVWQLAIVVSILAITASWLLGDRPVFFGALLIFGSFLFSLVSIYFFYGPTAKPLLEPFQLKYSIKAGLWIAILSPIFFYCLAGSFLVYYPGQGRGVTKWDALPLQQLIEVFNFNLSGQAGGQFFGVSRAVVYSLIFYPLGVVLAIVQGKRWALLFLIQSFYFYFYIYIVGYSDTSVALANRHFLSTQLPVLFFVAYGLVTSAELLSRGLFNLLALGFGKLKFYWTATFFTVLRKPAALSLSLLFAVSFLVMDRSAIQAGIQGWYDQKWEDWHSYGKYLNEHLEPGTLLFFSDQGFQYHVGINTDPRTYDLIFDNRTLPGQTERKVWQAVSGYEPERAERIWGQGFETILTVFPGVAHLLEKKFPVQSKLQVVPDVHKKWSFEGGDFAEYGFVRHADVIQNWGLRVEQLSPTRADEWAYLQYRFEVPKGLTLASFRTKLNLSTRDSNQCLLQVSTDGLTFVDVSSISESGVKEFDLTKQVAGAGNFYVRLAAKVVWQPRDYVDALHSTMLNDIDFSADFQ